ncbi:MAG: TIGR03084 family metal-binding protein [Jatrophihabitantaceae bacterium]
MADLDAVLADLRSEGDALELLVADLAAARWRTPTPAAGWTIAHQIAHLAWTDAISCLAATEPARFQQELERAIADVDGYVDTAAADGARQPPSELLVRWHDGRTALLAALAAVPPGTRLPWFGPPMSPTSMATARIMETWAHGQDIADALRLPCEPSARLRHVAHLGVRTRDFAYLVNARTPPAEAFRVELSGPRGESWTWGPPDAPQRVTGPALDFCLLVTQRRHRAELALHVAGHDADEWLDIAQAFAGPPGAGRPAPPPEPDRATSGRPTRVNVARSGGEGS